MNEKKLFTVLAGISMPMMVSAQLLGSLFGTSTQSLLGTTTKTLTSRIIKKQSLKGSKVYLYNVECGKFLGT